jgi:hypothetical protein
MYAVVKLLRAMGTTEAPRNAVRRSSEEPEVRIGASLFLIAVGAILKFAVTDHVNNINLGVVGVILMIIGGVGLLFELVMMASSRRTMLVARAPRTTYVEPADRY